MSLNRRILKWTGLALAALAVFCGLLVGVSSIFFERMPQYRIQAQAWINARSGLDIEFAQLRARWRWYGPELVFDHAIVRTADLKRTLAVARRGGLGFDVWAALRTGRLKAGRLFLEGTELRVVRTPSGRIEFVGQDALPDFNPDEPFDADALPAGQLHVRDARISFRDLKTGRGPWVVQGAEFDLQRGSTDMQLSGAAALPKTLGKHLRFSASSEGRLMDPEALTWKFSIEGRDIDLAGWADVMPNDWPAPETGNGSFKLAGMFRGLSLVDCTGEFSFAHVAIATPSWSTPLPRPGVLQIPEPGGPLQSAVLEETNAPEHSNVPSPVAATPPNQLLSYSKLAAKFHVTHHGTWHTEVKQLQLSQAQSVWPESELELNFTRSEGGAYQIDGKTTLLLVDNLWPLLAYFPESENMAHVRALSATGLVRDIRWRYGRAADSGAQTYSVSARIERAGVGAVGTTPGFAGLTASVNATERGGTLELDSRDVSVHVPRLFRTPLPADILQGAISWERDDSALHITSKGLRVENSDGHVLANLSLSIPADHTSPVIELTAQAQDLHAVAAPRYMPAGIMSAKVLGWLDHAFPEGHVSRADLTLRGPLRTFPFRRNEGLFLIRAKIDGLKIDYQPGWDPATDVAVDAEFRNQGLSVHASSASVNGMHLEQSFARFKDFKDSELEIKTVTKGDLSQALTYLQRTPIGPALGDLFQNLQGSGAMQADVDLLLPIKDLSKRKVSVRTRLSDVQAALKGLDQQATAISGSLRVVDTAVREVDLDGVWLGGPVHAGSDDSKPTTTLNVRGHFLAAELSRALKLPPAFDIGGSADWRAQINFTGADAIAKVPLFSVDSELTGISIRLPAPFDKQPGIARPLHAEMTRAPGSALLRASLGEVRSLVRLAASDQGWGLDRGTIRVDSGTAALPDTPGLRIEGSIERLVLDDWLHLNTGAGRGGPEQPLSNILKSANLRIGTLSLFGYSWRDVRGLLQATDKAWRVDVSSADASGQVTVPYRLDGPQPIGLDLERLVLGSRAAAAGPASRTDPRDLPAVRARVGDFTFGDRRFGAIELHADRVPGGLKFPLIKVHSQSTTGEGNGEWLVAAGGQQHTALAANLESTDLRETMHDFNYADFIGAKRATLQAKLSWPGGIDEPFLAHASGQIALQVDDGQLFNVQPGAGRVLGLFSIADLRRRLSLDFSDLTDKGLSFDSIHGDFEVADGNAYTHNLLLRGPAAEVGIAGRMGFGARDYDQTAVVTGNLGATLPVAGVLAGGPVVGAALLVFSQLFKEPLKGVARGYYRITGHWDNPTVERIDAEELKEAATRAAEAESAAQSSKAAEAATTAEPTE